jgi:hypothetical protein
MNNGKYKYWLKEDNLAKVTKWAKDGLFDCQIAEKMGINKSTLYEWIKVYPEFSDAIKKGKEIADKEIVNALYKRALGYSCKEIREEYVVNADGVDNEGKSTKEITVTHKQEPPNTAALIYWLNNRRPDEWSNKSKLDVDGNINIADVLAKARKRLEELNDE